MSEDTKRSIDYLRHAHIRLECGLELLGVLLMMDGQLVIDRPVRIEYRDDGSIKLLPLSYFSNQEFIPIDYERISFQVVMNDSLYNRYEEFCKDFADYVNDAPEKDEEPIDTKVKKTLH